MPADGVKQAAAATDVNTSGVDVRLCFFAEHFQLSKLLAVHPNNFITTFLIGAFKQYV
jgi:hypothetical protein